MRLFLAVIGLLFFIFGVGELFIVRQGAISAYDQDEALVPPNPPEFHNPCLEIPIEFILDKRVMSDVESQGLTIHIQNNLSQDCTVPVALHAPDFVTSPIENTLETQIPARREGRMVWILSPKKTGTYKIWIAAGDQAQFMGITVTNVLGLTSLQAQLISILGSILGPMVYDSMVVGMVAKTQ